MPPPRNASTYNARPPTREREELAKRCLERSKNALLEFQKKSAALGVAVEVGGPRPLSTVSSQLAPPPGAALAPPAARKERFFLGANWKCKLGRAAAVTLCGELNAIAADFPSDVELVLFVPTLLIDVCSRLLDPPFLVGAQNVWDNGPLEEHTGAHEHVRALAIV